MNNNQRGFSLIELIGVLAIIAILGSIAAPKILSSIEEAKVQTVVQDANTLKTVATQYYKDTGTFPYQRADLGAFYNRLINNGAQVKGWNGPYIEKELKNPFSYHPSYFVSDSEYNFDLNGDGTSDVISGAVLYLVAPTSTVKAISQAIDDDGDDPEWYLHGKVITVRGTATGTNAIILLLSKP